MQGVDKETWDFHKKRGVGAVFGDETFKQWIFDELLPDLESQCKGRVICKALSVAAVIEMVAVSYQVSSEAITECHRGIQVENEARKVAMYLCQELCAARLVEIAKLFNLTHYGSVTFATHQIRKRKRSDDLFNNRLEAMIKRLVTN